MSGLKFTFQIIDVFTKMRFIGNPLALVHVPAFLPSGLTQDQKQLIAHEFNLSETMFIHENSSDSTPDAPVRIDIFTTDAELLFAGPWAVEDDKACIALKLGSFVTGFISKGWHELLFPPHSALLGTPPDLKGMLATLVPQPPPGPQIHGSAESADPAPPPPLSMCGPSSEATACPSAPHPSIPPRPPRSPKHPSPSLAPAPKRSYTDTVHDITALVNLAKTVPDLPSDCIIVIHQASIPPLPSQRKIKLTVAGPSRHQILVKSEAVVSASSFPSLVGVANCSLAKVDLRVDLCASAYGGISLFTSCVATAEEIQLVAAAVHKHLGYQVSASLPTSWSYLKIVDVPYFRPGTMDPVDSDYVKGIMAKSHMAPSFTLANAPCVMRNSAKSDSATVCSVWPPALCGWPSLMPGSLYVSIAGIGVTLLVPAIHRLHVVCGALVLILRLIIAFLLVVVGVIPQPTPLCQQPWREPHALTLLTV
ncbi:hypothetical protein AN958_09165 [Leucoagaricus sp. SymC.cos]|nr:hypothetical protein AN958_09165 [Leucoagaricus sp. SymC.cos]